MSENCKKCGNDTFNEGKLSGYAKLLSMETFFNTGSNMIVTFCSRCGEVNSMRVENPQKFSRSF